MTLHMVVRKGYVVDSRKRKSTKKHPFYNSGEIIYTFEFLYLSFFPLFLR